MGSVCNGDCGSGNKRKTKCRRENKKKIQLNQQRDREGEKDRKKTVYIL